MYPLCFCRRQTAEESCRTQLSYHCKQISFCFVKVGTWADGIIIQVVADNPNLKSHITESHPNFAEFTVVEAATSQQQLRTIYVGHLDEFHYVSTKHLVPCICSLKRGTLEEYLLNKTSVDNTEWICISCGKYLIMHHALL